MAAPDLLLIETASALVRRHNDGTIERPALDALQMEWYQLWDGFIAGHRTMPGDLDEAIFLAATLRHPLKDCIYLQLAVKLRATLVTADAKFAERAHPAHGNIELLSATA
jgi:predicted nucleic acid-binding protein